MQSSLRALLTGILDYAGLFPPARLPLDEAIRNYARYRGSPEAWMLGRFICPAARLAELAPVHEELFQSGPPFVFSALGRGGKSTEEFLTALAADLEAIAEFRRRHGDRVVVDVFELRLPADVQRSAQADAARAFFAAVSTQLDRLGPPRLTEFYEPSLGPDWREALTSLMPAVEGGLKLRCGGLEASAFPSVEQVAFALTACKDEGLRFKATAGLHHPFRHHDTSLATLAHGFVNVFGAGVLAHARDLDEVQVRAILADEDAKSWVFEEQGFRWKDLRATTEQIATARRDAVISFGSCSFEEPCDHLHALGWLP